MRFSFAGWSRARVPLLHPNRPGGTGRTPLLAGLHQCLAENRKVFIFLCFRECRALHGVALHVITDVMFFGYAPWYLCFLLFIVPWLPVYLSHFLILLWVKSCFTLPVSVFSLLSISASHQLHPQLLIVRSSRGLRPKRQFSTAGMSFPFLPERDDSLRMVTWHMSQPHLTNHKQETSQHHTGWAQRQ